MAEATLLGRRDRRFVTRVALAYCLAGVVAHLAIAVTVGSRITRAITAADAAIDAVTRAQIQNRAEDARDRSVLRDDLTGRLSLLEGELKAISTRVK